MLLWAPRTAWNYSQPEQPLAGMSEGHTNDIQPEKSKTSGRIQTTKESEEFRSNKSRNEAEDMPSKKIRDNTVFL